jgi:tetratricopeptide (TPR) repeat protein
MTLKHAAELQRTAWQLQSEGALDAAAQACMQALAVAEAAAGPACLDVVNLLNDLADIESERQRFSVALALAQRAQATLERSGQAAAGPQSARIAIKTRTLLGTLRRQLGQATPDAHDFVIAVDLALRWLGTDHDETAVARANLAVAYKFAGRFPAALALYTEVLEHFERSQGGSASPTLIALHHNIGGLHHAMGDADAAEAPARKAWEMAHAVYGANALATLLESVAYAAVMDAQGRHAAALAHCEAAHAGLLLLLGPEHAEVASVLHNMGATLAALGRCGEAEAAYREALRVWHKLQGPSSMDGALTSIGLAGVLNRQAAFAEASELLARAAAALDGQIEPGHRHWRVLAAHREAALRGLAAARP